VKRGWILLSAAISAGAYLATAFARNGDLGLPLDDAWIHQVYARNLGLRGEFSFFAGQPSAGSTSPLWALVLGLSYWLRIDYRIWTFALGIILLAASAWLAGRLANRIAERLNDGTPRASSSIAAIAVMLGEWHLVWASVSGMEVILFVLLELALVESLFANRNPALLGALAGLLTLTRPEGAVLGVLVALGLMAEKLKGDAIASRVGHSMIAGVKFLIPFALLLAPYVAFNLAASGTLLPNTFYAKSEEYLALTNEPLVTRWFSLWLQPLTGAQVLFVPGLFFLAWRLVRKFDVAVLVPLAWVVSLVSLYALRLPVSYQHGRYEMTIIPFVAIYGVIGTQWLTSRLPRLLRRAMIAAAGVLLFAFWLIGAEAYATDVSIIDCEMVATARWSAQNIPTGDRIAVHDIGAQAYFDSHPLIDLAGLVTPDVIPFIRDEARLSAFIREREAVYLIFFPDWYPRLAEDASLTRIFTTGCAVTREQGGQNLGVYRVNR
jgi:hypothetical protein